MYEGKSKELWDHTSHILWIIHSVNCSKKNEQKEPKDFNKWEQIQKDNSLKNEKAWSELKTMFKREKK